MSVYFLQAGAGGPIKIGHSKDPWRRLDSHQVSNPETCQIVGIVAGGAEEEAELHRRFAADRLQGEWFCPSADLLSFVQQHRPDRSRVRRQHRTAFAGTIATASDLIAAVGGTKAACALTGRGATAISNWRVWNRLPATTFMVLQVELQRRGLEAPMNLWSFDAPGAPA